MDLSDIPPDVESVPALPGFEVSSVWAPYAREALMGRDLIPYEVAARVLALKEAIRGEAIESFPNRALTTDPVEAIQMDLGHKLLRLRMGREQRAQAGKKPKFGSLLSWGLLVTIDSAGDEMFYVQVGCRMAGEAQTNWFFR